MWNKLKNSPQARISTWLLLGVLLVFSQSVFFNFIALDDSKHIWSNNYVNTLTLKNLMFFWQQPYYGLYIPVVYNAWSFLADLSQSLGIKHPISGYGANLFHLTNLILHMFNTWLVFQLFQFLALKNSHQSKRDGASPYLAGIAAAFFAIHPLQVEAVAWVSGLKDVLSTNFALISLLLFLRGFQSEDKPRKKSRKKKKQNREGLEKQDIIYPTILRSSNLKMDNFYVNYFLSFGLFLLSIFTKPSVIVLPLVIYLILTSWMGHKKHLRPLILFFITIVPIVQLTKSLQPNTRLEFTLSLWQYPLIALHALGFYTAKFILPLNLAPDYGLSPKVALQSTEFYFYVALGSVPILAGVWLLLKKQSSILTGLLIFFIGLFPVLGFVPFEYQNMSTVADRYMYFVPMLGLGMIILCFPQIWVKINLRTTSQILILGLLILSFQQTLHWKDNAHLFARVLEVNPNSYLSLNNIGLVHLRAEEFPSAEKYFKQALEIKSDYTAAQSNLGVVYFKQKLYGKVIEHYSKILKDHPNLTAGASATFADMHYNLGAALLNSGKTTESIYHLNKAAEINVNHFAAQFHRGRVYAHLGELENAKNAFLQAYRINPKSPDVVTELKKLQSKGTTF